MGYQWDAKKAALNLKSDAVGVLEDDWALTIEEREVEGEQRFLTLGMDFLARVLVVVYTYRGDDIRLISARPATKKERKIYEQKRKSV